MTHTSYCPREKAWVSFIDQDCFRWQPRKNPSTKLWEWGESKVLRQAFMEYAKSISLITETLQKNKMIKRARVFEKFPGKSQLCMHAGVRTILNVMKMIRSSQVRMYAHEFKNQNKNKN